MTRDSWPNWRLHLGTKTLTSNLLNIEPWKVCIFFPQNLLGVMLLRNEVRIKRMAHEVMHLLCKLEALSSNLSSTKNIKNRNEVRQIWNLNNCNRFKFQHLLRFLKNYEIVKIHMNQVFLCVIGRQAVHCTISVFQIFRDGNTNSE
jgi:hypothetical protein